MYNKIAQDPDQTPNGTNGRLSVDSRPRRENGSPGFDGFHLLGEQVETPPLTATSEVCQISILRLM